MVSCYNTPKLGKVLEPQYVPIEFNPNGKNSSVRIGRLANMAFEPITNPMTGNPEGIRIQHETGFIFQTAEVVSAKECKASFGELKFSYPGKSGFVTKIHYNN